MIYIRKNHNFILYIIYFYREKTLVKQKLIKDIVTTFCWFMKKRINQLPGYKIAFDFPGSDT